MADLNFSSSYTPPELPYYTTYSGGVLNFFFWDKITVNRILYATSDNYITVWADSDASLTNGKFYMSTDKELSIINLSDNTLYDRYDVNNKGRGNEALQDDNIFDTNVV